MQQKQSWSMSYVTQVLIIVTIVVLVMLLSLLKGCERVFQPNNSNEEATTVQQVAIVQEEKEEKPKIMQPLPNYEDWYWSAEVDAAAPQDVVVEEPKISTSSSADAPQEVVETAKETSTSSGSAPPTFIAAEVQPPQEQHLTARGGVFQGPSGKETYYNLPMGGVINIMRNMGFTEEDYPYWVREDGCKMLGPYIMVAANLELRPRGTTVETSLGTGLVCDTGGFAVHNPTQVDIAVSWK